MNVQNQQNSTPNRAVPVDTEYDAFVDGMAIANDSTTLQNDSTSCALSVLRAIVKNSSSNIDVFSGSLDPRVFDDIALDKYFKDFITKNGKLRFLIQNKAALDETTPPPLILSNIANQPNVEIAYLPGTVSEKHIPHFTVADSRAYRLEVNAAKHQALVNFNDPEFTVQLHTCFNELWTRATTVENPEPATAATTPLANT